MKMTQEHVDQLSAAIRPLDTEELRAAYRAGNFPNAERVQNLDRRYRFDLFYTAARADSSLYDMGGYLDSHLYTALKKIVPSL